MQIAGKRIEFLLGTMYFIGNDGDQNFLVFASVLNSLIEMLLTRHRPEYHLKKPNHLILTLKRSFNLGNARKKLKFNNSVLVQ